MELTPKQIYDDDCLTVLLKPPGWFVHPTDLDPRAPNVWAWLLDHGLKGFGVHRLDRATSGVLVFAKTSACAADLCEQFRLHQVEKSYEAIVRGFMPLEGDMTSPVQDLSTGRSAPAHTRFRTLATYTHPKPFGRYAESRFSWVELKPTTGRKHQLRRQLAHLRHPILGDSTYGDNKLNRHMSVELGWSSLQLFATSLSFRHPVSGLRMSFSAPGVLSDTRRFQFPV